MLAENNYTSSSVGKDGVIIDSSIILQPCAQTLGAPFLSVFVIQTGSIPYTASYLFSCGFPGCSSDKGIDIT